MNLPELKKDFYQRFNQSDDFLHFTANGLLCTLLGHTEIEDAPSLTFTLSMRVQMFARKIGGNLVNIEDSASDKCLSYHFGTPPKLFRGREKFIAELIESLNRYNLNGAEILCDCSIPEFLPKKEVFAVTLAQSLFKVSGVECDMLDIAASCSSGSDVTPLIGILSARKGYCTLISSGRPKNFPLPLSGYKILSAHCTEKRRDRSKYIKPAFEKICRLYPHVMSVSDITPEIFNGAKSAIKDKTALRYIYHLTTENIRIKSAADALKKCSIKNLFTEMKNSQKSMERFWDIGSEHRFLAHCCKNVDGIAAVRLWDNGIAAIVEEDKIDYAISVIRHEFENNIGYQPTLCVSEPF